MAAAPGTSSQLEMTTNQAIPPSSPPWTTGWLPHGHRCCSAMLGLAWLALLAAPSTAQDYVIGPRDVVALKVVQAPEFDGSFKVGESGQINHPLIGDVQLAGLTRPAAEQKIRELLEVRFLQKGRATVSLEVGEYLSRPIHLLGAVKKPGQLPSFRRWTLLQAITEAGGLNAGRGSVAQITRRAGNGLGDRIDIDLDDLLLRGDPRLNLPLFPDDVVNFPESYEITVYCLGEVVAPGAITFSSSEDVTLMAAIAKAGGLTDRAKRRIVIKRQSENGMVEDIQANYKDILEGRAPNITLQKGDLIQVGMSFL